MMTRQVRRLMIMAASALVLASAAQAQADAPCSPSLRHGAPGMWCRVTQADTVFGIAVSVGSFVRYDSAGALRVLSLRHPAQYQGLRLAGDGDGPHQVFRPDGTPEMLWLDGAQEVQGVPCRPMSFWTEVTKRSSRLLFHPSGRLRACRTSRAATVQGIGFARGALVEFDAAGKLLSKR